MKDILDPLLKQLPGYLPDLVSLITGPKTAILHQVDEARGDLTQPLVFVSVSVAIGFLLQLPQIGKENDFATLAASMAVIKVLALVIFALIIHLVFRAAGGHASFNSTFSAYLYIVSPLYIVLVILETAKLGILRTYDPIVYAAVRLDPNYFANTERWLAFTTDKRGLGNAYMLLNFTMIIVIFGWFITCWGALSHLHAVACWRSILAGITTLVGGVIFFSGMNYVLLGMFGTYVPPLR